MMDHGRIDLALFFTRGVSLHQWQQIGMLRREVALYQRLVDDGHRVVFVTYGDRRDEAIAADLGGIRVCCNQRRLPPRLYEAALPWLHRGPLRGCNLFKTNQINGAMMAVRIARRWEKPLIARCGYMWSFNEKNKRGDQSVQYHRALAAERRAFGAATRVVVTTQRLSEEVSARLPEVRDRIRVIPNYVETDRFAPDPLPDEPKFDVLYVGRLVVEKNVDLLLDAVAPLGIRLAVVGNGPLAAALKNRPLNGDTKVAWLGNRSHTELPSLMNQARLFVLPSRFEGHPKALIEAMACGRPVVGTDVPGIGNLLRHEQTGLLCQPSVVGLRSAIQRMLGDAPLRERLGAAARAEAIARFSLDEVYAKELAVLGEAIAAGCN